MRCVKCQIEEKETRLTPSGECLPCFRPDAQEVLKAAARLRSYATQAGENGTVLCMTTSAIWKDTPCKTVACFAGHYFMASLAENREEAQSWHFEREYGEGGARTVPVLLNTKTKFRVEYARGANLLAQDLGFSNKDQLQIWAKLHPGFWGGHNGELMFSARLAFERTDLSLLTVIDVADWLKALGHRLALASHQKEARVGIGR